MDLDPVFDAAGQSWNVDPDLLRAMSRQESVGKDSAVSPAGAQGRMQVMPDTFRGLGGTDINDPVQNIYAGAKYMSQALDAEKGNPQLALLFYHGGPQWRDKYGLESAAYVPGVSAHYQAIQAAKAKQPDGGADVPKQAKAPAAADDDEAAGKALIDQLTAGAGKPAALPQGQPATSAAPANDDEAAGKALIERMMAPATKTADAPAAPAGDGGAAPGPRWKSWGDVANDAMSGAAGVVGSLTHGLSFGLDRPVDAAISYLAPNSAFARMHAENVQSQKAFEEAHPYISGGAEMVGSVPGFALGENLLGRVLPPIAGSGVVRNVGNVATAAGRNALLGGAAGAALTDGDLNARIEAARQGALLGAVLGPVGEELRPSANALARPTAGVGPRLGPTIDGTATEVPPGPSPGMGGPQTQAAGAAPQFLDSAWIKQQASDASGAYDMEAGGKAIAGAVEDALKRGDTVTYMADGGRKAVPIVAVKNGMMQDATGQRWGAAQLASDGTGKEGVQITPKSGAAPGMGGPQPQAAGAAPSSAAEATMTPDEILANRHVAEKDWLNRTIQPGVEDNRELVSGNNPTLAQREQNAATSREQKSLMQQNPELAQEEQELLDQHDTNRKKMYAQPDLAGSTVLLNNAEKAANDKLKAGLNAAFANKTAADAQPVVTMADKFLSGREGKRAAIETEVRGVRARLFDDAGKLETDPEILWGVREHINDVLSKENQRQNPVSGRAQGVLIQLRDQLDGVIDPAAPGFRAAIKGYAEDMKAPDVTRALQERENGLLDSKGRMQFSRFHSLMRDIVDARQPGAALSPFQHISDEQMVKLQNLHDDLKRAATAQDLAVARGSDTAQNLWDAARTYAKGRGTAAINMIPYVGGLVRHGQEAYAPYKEMKAQQNALNRGIEMLRPPPDKYPTRQPLGD